MDTFSLLYSNLLLAKLCLIVFGATFAELHWQFSSICSYSSDYVDIVAIIVTSFSVAKRAWLSG